MSFDGGITMARQMTRTMGANDNNEERRTPMLDEDSEQWTTHNNITARKGDTTITTTRVKEDKEGRKDVEMKWRRQREEGGT